MDALLVEPLSLLRHVATGAAVAAGVMIGLGTLTLQKPAGAIPAVAQSSLRIDLEPSDDAAVRALVPARADALSLEAMADPDLGRQLARPLVPEPHAMPVSFDEANIVF